MCKEWVHSLVDCHTEDRCEKSLGSGGDRGEEHLGYLGASGCMCVCVCVSVCARMCVDRGGLQKQLSLVLTLI